MRVTDTTGAGDSFAGAYLVARHLQGRDLRSSMAYAARCAALTVCGHGARSFPTVEDCPLHVDMVITAIVVSCIIVLFGILAIVNVTGVSALTKQAQAFAQVDYAGAQLTPDRDADGLWYFETDREFKVMQLTDVHIGAGFASQKKDAWAMNAVATMITQEKPDLVIVTGDIAYPVPTTSTPPRSSPI